MKLSTTQVVVRVAAPTVLIVLLGAAWQYVAYHFATVLPPLQDMWRTVVDKPGFYGQNLWTSLWGALVGFAIGTVVALILAILMTQFAFLRAAIMPIATMLHVTPIVAIAPALVVAFGFTVVPHLIVAAISAFFPMLINAISGFKAVDPQTEEIFAAMSAGRAETFSRLRLPASLPFLFAGGRVAITAAMVGEVVSEFFGSVQGLGAVITTSSSNLDLPTMWTAIFISALISLVLLGVVGALNRAVVRW